MGRLCFPSSWCAGREQASLPNRFGGVVPHHAFKGGNRGRLGASIAEEHKRVAVRLGLVQRAPRPVAINYLGTGDTFIHGN